MLKKKIYQSLTLAMAFLILLSSVGYGFVEHHCKMSGKSMMYVSDRSADLQIVGKADFCCAKTKLQNSSKNFPTITDCCKVEHKFHKAEVIFSGVNSLLKLYVLGPIDLFWANNAFVFYSSAWHLTISAKSDSILSFTSLYYGKTMRFFMQSFII